MTQNEHRKRRRSLTEVLADHAIVAAERDRWQQIEHMLVTFGQVMYLTVDELVRAMVWLNGRGHAFSIQTMHLRSDDPRRYQIVRD